MTQIAEKLGLSPDLISKCKTRYQCLHDGEWKQIVDSEQKGGRPLSQEWRDFALQFWVDPEASDEHGNALNFVRRSERSADEIRDPKNRKSSERYRIVCGWRKKSARCLR